MDIWDMQRAVNEARDTLKAADTQASRMASLLEGRLRHVSGYTLSKLKKELRDFNANTGKWKS